jgi:PEGA domain-containing protein
MIFDARSAPRHVAIAIFAIFVIFALFTPRVHAQTADDKKRALDLQSQGLQLMERGDFRASLAKFDEAYAIVKSPKILFNVGKASRELGDDVKALDSFERFLDEAPYAPKASRAWASREVEALRTRLAYIEVQTEDVGSTISIDGKDVGRAPLARATVVAPGTHEVRVELAAMTPAIRSVSPIAGQKVRVVVKLVPRAPAPTQPLVATSAVELPIAAPQTPAAPAPTPTDTGTPHPWQISAAWISGGVGVALLVGGVVAQLSSASKIDAFNHVVAAPNPTMQCNQQLPAAGGGSCQGLLDASHLRHDLAVAAFIGAGAALAGSAVLFLTAPSRADTGRGVAVGCSPLSKNVGLSCGLTLRF